MTTADQLEEARRLLQLVVRSPVNHRGARSEPWGVTPRGSFSYTALRIRDNVLDDIRGFLGETS